MKYIIVKQLYILVYYLPFGMSRYDMHMAFRGNAKVIDELKRICKLLDSSNMKGDLYYRPRFGVFVQADCCGNSNLSGETVIPTFTCNFIVDACSAEDRMQEIVDIVYNHDEDGVLKDNFLRVRCEGQLPILKYNPIKGCMDEINDRPKDFPANVRGLEYFDAHIHILGLTVDNAFDLWPTVAKVGTELGMPIIINRLKIETRVVKPFYTKRWYDTLLDNAITSLGEIYNVMYERLTEIGLKPVMIPEFEVTMNDPDCQVTDQGWMPTPFCKFELDEGHTLIPIEVMNAIKDNSVN